MFRMFFGIKSKQLTKNMIKFKRQVFFEFLFDFSELSGLFRIHYLVFFIRHPTKSQNGTSVIITFKFKWSEKSWKLCTTMQCSSGAKHQPEWTDKATSEPAFKFQKSRWSSIFQHQRSTHHDQRPEAPLDAFHGHRSLAYWMKIIIKLHSFSPQMIYRSILCTMYVIRNSQT